jgi:hypothetical protein
VNEQSRAATRSQFFGQNFENFLSAQHNGCLLQGILAWWRHVSPKVKWVRRPEKCPRCKSPNWGAHATVVGDACADYVGQLVSGQALTVEAKSYAGRFGFSELEEHQVKMLDACARNGGLALLALELRPDPKHPECWAREWGPWKRFAVRWDRVPWRVRGAGKSLGVEDLSGWEMRGQLYLKRFLEEP